MMCLQFLVSFRDGLHVQCGEIDRTALLRLTIDCRLGIAVISATQTGKLAAVRAALVSLVWFSLAFATPD